MTSRPLIIILALGLTFLHMSKTNPALKAAAVGCLVAAAGVVANVRYRNTQ